MTPEQYQQMRQWVASPGSLENARSSVISSLLQEMSDATDPDALARTRAQKVAQVQAIADDIARIDRVSSSLSQTDKIK